MGWLSKYDNGGKKKFLEPNDKKLPSGRIHPFYYQPSSELAQSIGGEEGEPAYLIPTFKYGHPLDNPLEEYKRTGEHLGGPFKTWQEADEWDKTIRHPYVEKGEALPSPLKRWGKDYENGDTIPYGDGVPSKGFAFPKKKLQQGGKVYENQVSRIARIKAEGEAWRAKRMVGSPQYDSLVNTNRGAFHGSGLAPTTSDNVSHSVQNTASLRANICPDHPNCGMTAIQPTMSFQQGAINPTRVVDSTQVPNESLDNRNNASTVPGSIDSYTQLMKDNTVDRQLMLNHFKNLSKKENGGWLNKYEQVNRYNTGFKGEYQNGGEMSYYQHGLDFKPKTISKNGSVVKDNLGYLNPENFGKVIEIDSPNITMRGVREPLIGISNLGEKKMMIPEHDYLFKGKKVTEYPIGKYGINELNELTNFTNTKSGKWLNKYS